MDQATLKKLHDVEIEILTQIDTLCKKHDIPYSMYSGTQLGAVRHQGFIPWDDDMDVCMERTDYERFCKIWQEETPEGFVLQDPRKLEYSTINHAKVMKLNTAFGSKEDYAMPGFHGIFVDVFVMDRVPTEKFKKMMLKIMASLRLVYTRGYPITKKGKFFENLSRIMLKLPAGMKKNIRDYCERYVSRYRDYEGDYCLMSLACPEELSMEFPADTTRNVEDVPFEGKMFSNSKEADKILRIVYGDYMQLPPESEQICKHNPEILDFGD